MKRKKVINSASETYMNGLFEDGVEIPNEDYENIFDAFCQGAEWADNNPKSTWISVEDDLPCNHDCLLIKCLPYNSKVTKPVLVLVADGSYQVCEMFANKEDEWEWSCNDVVLNWYPIPEPPE